MMLSRYGHPKGRSMTGAMSHDVLEILQGLSDLQGGSYLLVSAMTPLETLFGDPCPVTAVLKSINDISILNSYLY